MRMQPEEEVIKFYLEIIKAEPHCDGKTKTNTNKCDWIYWSMPICPKLYTPQILRMVFIFWSLNIVNSLQALIRAWPLKDL